MDNFDPISVIEAAYRLAVPDEIWMRGILQAVKPQWDDGWGVGMFEVGLDERGRPRFGARVFDSPEPELFEQSVLQMNQHVDEAQIEHAYRNQHVLATLSERVAPIRPDFREDPVYRQFAHPHGVYDFLAVQIADPSGTMLMLGAPLTRIAQTSREQRHRWARVAAHIAAAYRLRRAGAGAAEGGPEHADAVLSSDGTILDVGDPDLADEAATRDRLELAAEAIGRARGAMRQAAPDDAIDLWKALVEARYSLVEHLDSDRRRLFLAHRNPPAAAEPVSLEPLERQIVQFAAMGHSDELIAYELGLAVAVVRQQLDSGLDKLGCSSRGELLALWASFQRQRS